MKNVKKYWMITATAKDKELEDEAIEYGRKTVDSYKKATEVAEMFRQEMLPYMKVADVNIQIQQVS